MYVTLDLQPPFQEVSHRWNPAAGNCKAYGTLRLVDGAVNAKVYFNARAEIDAVMAELTALRAEMPGEDVTVGSDDAAWEKHVAHANRDGKLTAGEPSARLAAMEPRDRERLLYFINGYCPSALLSALASEEKTRTAREAEPEPTRDQPASSDAATVLANSIATGTPVTVTELCDSELPLRNAGPLKCTLDDGHYGAHSALGGKRRWLGTGADARDENGDKIAPASVTA